MTQHEKGAFPATLHLPLRRLTGFPAGSHCQRDISSQLKAQLVLEEDQGYRGRNGISSPRGSSCSTVQTKRPAMTSLSRGRSDPATLTLRATEWSPTHDRPVKVLLLMQLRVNWFLQRRNHNCGSFNGRMGECVVVVGNATMLAKKNWNATQQTGKIRFFLAHIYLKFILK